MKHAPQNLFEFRPARIARWETADDGLAVILAPKFTNRVLVRFLVPRLRNPDLRVHLDAIGTFVWQQCDGGTTVTEIGRRTWERFGGERDAIEHRVADFVAQLDRQRFVQLRRSGEAASA